MSYATIADLEQVFGKHNVRQWADINNTKNKTEEDTRMQWALDEATDELDERLRRSAYQFPVTTTPVPKLLVRNVCYLAGRLLYESRGIVDQEQAEYGKLLDKRVNQFVSDLINRKVFLELDEADTPIVTTDVPFAVNFDD